jgi:acyl carrier protein
MVNSDIFVKIRSICENRLQIAVPADDTDLFETGLMDSLMLVDLLAELEREFSFRLTLTELDVNSFRTIQGIAAFVVGEREKQEREIGSYQAIS